MSIVNEISTNTVANTTESEKVLSHTVSIDNTAETTTKIKTPRAKTLPEKFGKFIRFGFHVLTKYNEIENQKLENALPIDEKSFMNVLQMFGSVVDQAELVKSFLDNG